MQNPASTWSRVWKWLPVALIVLGFTGWFGAGLISVAGHHFIPRSLPLPLSQPQGLAVDSEGRIYVASGFYHRVQVYDAEGRYLRGWFLPHGHKNFRLRIGEDQALEAVASGRLFRFDPSGVELSSRGETTSTFDSTPKHSFTTPTHHYEVRDLASPEVSIYPRVVRFGPQGPETVVTSPWLLWPVQGVFPAFGWAVLGMALLGLRRFGRVDRLS